MATLFSVLQPIDDFIHTEIDETLWLKLDIVYIIRYLSEICHLNIMKTCPCNVYPPEPHFYIAKLGYAGVYLFFLFLLQNIDYGYSLELPRRAKIRKISIFFS